MSDSTAPIIVGSIVRAQGAAPDHSDLVGVVVGIEPKTKTVAVVGQLTLRGDGPERIAQHLVGALRVDVPAHDCELLC